MSGGDGAWAADAGAEAVMLACRALNFQFFRAFSLYPSFARIFTDTIETALARVRDLNETKFADFFKKG
jgi:hypothetical protein